jgi:3D (Asp-Asp-Asp) domain-containing protein
VPETQRISVPPPRAGIYNCRVIISRSLWRKALVTAVAVGAFVSAYEVTILDSKYAAQAGELRETPVLPTPGARLPFSATAYCKGITTSSGTPVQSGVAAADPELLPVGSVVQLDSLPAHYNGIYTVLDTGPSIQGRLVDLYMWSCHEALEFGRQPIRLTVLRLGWNPRATTPSLLDRLFNKRPETATLPSRPLSQVPADN